MYEQFLPNYRHDFLKDPRWILCESPHYRFRYFADSVAAHEIDIIKDRQESAYKKIISFFGISEPRSKIDYYFYSDAETKSVLMGDDWYAQSIYDEFCIHVLYTDKIKPIGEHEDTHLLSLPWGLSIGFFQEGLAEFMVGHAWDGRPHIDYVHKGYRKNIYTPLINFMSHEAWLKPGDTHTIYFYSLAGAFVTFLISTYGKGQFEQFYRQSSRKNTREQNSHVFNEIYGRSVEHIEREFANKNAIKKGDEQIIQNIYNY